MPERFEWVRDRERLDQIAQAWDDLAEADYTPFASHAWFGAWLDAFATGAELRVLAGWDGERLVSVLPLLARGRGLAAASNWHTPVFRAAATGAAEARAAYEHAAQESGSLRIGVLRDDDPGLEAILSAPRARTLREAGPVQPALDLGTGVEEWRRSLSKNRSKDLRRRTRRMQEEHETRLYALEVPDLETELERGLRTEAAGWKGATGTAILSRPDTDRFYRTLAARWHTAGKLRFCGLEIDAQLAAFELMVVHDRRVFSIKGGYDERFSAFAPGLQVQVAAIERAFELGMKSYEFLGADEPWKRSLANAERPTTTVRTFPSTLGGRARHVLWARAVPRLRQARARARALRARG